MAFFTTFRRENPSAIGANNKCRARNARAIWGDRANGLTLSVALKRPNRYGWEKTLRQFCFWLYVAQWDPPGDAPTEHIRYKLG
jgi:hypothetical protein